VATAAELPRLPSFPATDAEALERFEATRGEDPFPEIPPALLNTADLLDYVSTTGMIHPFHVEPSDPTEMLKPASCGIRLAGDVVYWDTDVKGNPKKKTRTLESGEELYLKRNSIVYVTLEPMLRLPDYIAARFNLTIRDIYRGILVGTGPLVDPGFTGRLSLPLHNLTFNDYPLKGGEPLVWMEFTKISPHPSWENLGQRGSRESSYVNFPPRKRRHDIHDYLQRAYPGPITSSIPPLLEGANSSAKNAENAVRRQSNIFASVSILGLAGFIVALVTLVIAVLGVVNDADTDRDKLIRRVDALTSKVQQIQRSENQDKRRKP
jgi:deoxycytidine triphosphate deaminase